jgi:[acyl-carrier-protein] S-malonyltransferase
VYCAGIARWRAQGSVEPAFMTGHSLGEITALAAAGAVPVEVGAELVWRRGELMHESGLRHGDGGMLAMRGGLGEARTLADRFDLHVANDNSPRQVILAGAVDALEAACEAGRAERITCKVLPTSGAFHSPFMADAAEPFAELLSTIEFVPPRVPVYSSCDAGPFLDPAEQLARALTHGVRWRQTVLALWDQGVGRFVDVGPGKVLAGLARQVAPEAEAVVGAAAVSPARSA